MQLTSLLTLAGAALASVLGVTAAEQQQQGSLTTIWVPTATVVETNTYTATRIEQIWTTVPPYEWETTFPVVWTAVETKTQYAPLITDAPQRRHARDFELS